MQRIGETTYRPEYVEKLIIYLTSTDQVIVTMGNRQWAMTATELEQVLKNKLASHALFVEIVRGEKTC